MGHSFRKQGQNEVVIIPDAHAKRFIEDTHLDSTIKHMGAQKLVEKIKEYAHVTNLTSIVRKVIEACGRCIQSKTEIKKEQRVPVL